MLDAELCKLARLHNRGHSKLRPYVIGRLRPQGLIEIGEKVFDILDTNGEADEVRCDAGSELLFRAELLVGRCGGMYRKRLGIADVGQMTEKLQVIDEFAAGFEAIIIS